MKRVQGRIAVIILCILLLSCLVGCCTITIVNGAPGPTKLKWVSEQKEPPKNFKLEIPKWDGNPPEFCGD